MSEGARISHTITSGTFSLDGGTWDVDNNVWVVGNDTECVVIDAPHDAEAIAGVINGRDVKAILLTHAHDDHIDAAAALSKTTGAPTYLHPDDRMLWDRVYAEGPDYELSDGQRFDVAGVSIEVLHTPGHSPGACCFFVADLDVVFTGDTLFSGGPGATGRSFSSFDTIVESITDRLLALPPATRVNTGHGDSTTIEDEAAGREGWKP